MIAEELAKVLAPPMNEEFLTVQECADLLKISPNTVGKKKELPRIELGGRVLYPKSKIIKYVYSISGGYL